MNESTWSQRMSVMTWNRSPSTFLTAALPCTRRPSGSGPRAIRNVQSSAKNDMMRSTSRLLNASLICFMSAGVGPVVIVSLPGPARSPAHPRASQCVRASSGPRADAVRAEPPAWGVLPLQVLFGGREVRSRLQRQPGMTGQLPPFLPHIERLLLHRRKHRGDLLDVEIRRHARIAGALDHRRELALLELLQRPGERILDQSPIPVDAMVLVARAVVVVGTVPEVIKGQELGLFRVLLARRPADIGQHVDRETAIAHWQPPHFEPEPDVAGLEDMGAAVVLDGVALRRSQFAGTGFDVRQDVRHRRHIDDLGNLRIAGALEHFRQLRPQGADGPANRVAVDGRVHPVEVRRGRAAEHRWPFDTQVRIFRTVDVASFEVEAVEPQQRCLLAGNIRHHQDCDALIRMILDVAVPQFVADGEGQPTGAESPLLHLFHRQALLSELRFNKAAASLATAVPSKMRGFCVPHSRTALPKTKSWKSLSVMRPSSTSSKASGSGSRMSTTSKCPISEL